MSIAIFIVSRLISLYATLMLIYCLCSWFIRDPSNPVMHFFALVVEPPLQPIRNFLNRYEFFRNSPVDFSSLVMFFLLRVVLEFLARVI